MEPEDAQSVLDVFQGTVDDVLIRHRSILDVLTKLHEAQARLARAAATAVTVCGCITVHADRQRIPPDADLASAHLYVRSHLDGNLCERCRETIETEMGEVLFYQGALANLLGVRLADVLNQELDRLRMLGVFHLS
jgi:hypothetical protein